MCDDECFDVKLVDRSPDPICRRQEATAAANQHESKIGRRHCRRRRRCSYSRYLRYDAR